MGEMYYYYYFIIILFIIINQIWSCGFVRMCWVTVSLRDSKQLFKTNSLARIQLPDTVSTQELNVSCILSV